jgi:hypothetical protein
MTNWPRSIDRIGKPPLISRAPGRRASTTRRWVRSLTRVTSAHWPDSGGSPRKITITLSPRRSSKACSAPSPSSLASTPHALDRAGAAGVSSSISARRRPGSLWRRSLAPSTAITIEQEAGSSAARSSAGSQPVPDRSARALWTSTARRARKGWEPRIMASSPRAKEDQSGPEPDPAPGAADALGVGVREGTVTPR